MTEIKFDSHREKKIASFAVRAIEGDHKAVVRLMRVIGRGQIPNEEQWEEIKNMTKEHEPENKGDIVFDLDGVLANYEGGWEEHSDEPGRPEPAARRSLRLFKEHGYTVGVYSTREASEVWGWLKKHMLDKHVDWVNENPNQPPGTSGKPIWRLYIGDRALRCEYGSLWETSKQGLRILEGDEV